MFLQEKIYGSLLGGAVGDAMGAATEMRPMELILERFGGFVEDFIPAPDDTFLRGMPKGYATDDFSLAYYTAKAIVDQKGVNEKAAQKALLDWSETQYYTYAGPSTKRAVNDIIGVPNPERPHPFLVCHNESATNGSAMKIAPVGMINAGNLDKAIQDSIIINQLTHNNNISLAGGAAIACAVAEAMSEQATVDSIVKASIYGAEIGYELGSKTAKRLAGPSVAKRIELAVQIAQNTKGDFYDVIKELADVIGAGLMAVEAVPAAMGIFVAAQGDVKKSIFGGVNIGDDTDTVATMVGAIAGAFHGAAAFPQEWIDLIEQENHFDLLGLSKEMAAI